MTKKFIMRWFMSLFRSLHSLSLRSHSSGVISFLALDCGDGAGG